MNTKLKRVCIGIVISSIVLSALLFCAIMHIVNNREEKARQILAHYDGVISRYCNEVIYDKQDDTSKDSLPLSQLCNDRRCSITAEEISGVRYKRIGIGLKRKMSSFYVDRKGYPSETMCFCTFVREDGVVVNGLSYTKRMIQDGRKIVLKLDCQLDDLE